MAIIYCPECGGSISDTVKTCIHCGCKLTYCKECGSISVGDKNTCETCGFIFTKAISNSELKTESKGEIKDTKELYQKWSFENSFLSKINKSYIVFALLAISIVMLAIAVVKIVLFFSSNTNSFDALLKFDDTFSSIRIFLILALVFYILFSGFDDVRGYVVCSNMQRWIEFKKLSAVDIVKNTLSMDFTKMSVDSVGEYAGSVEATISADIYSKDIITKVKEKRLLVAKVILSAATAVLLCLFIIDNLETYMAYHLLNGSGFEISIIGNWWMLIAAVGCFAVSKIVSSNADKLSKAAEENWVNENVAEYAENYEKYVKNYIEYLVDKVDSANRKV